jgi:integrase
MEWSPRPSTLNAIVACFTGAELSALERLDWWDVDFMANSIRLPGTKNATRDRTVGLDPQLASVLAKVPTMQRTGRVLRPWVNACHDLAIACDRAGIQKVTPHSLRHTFASWLVQAAVDTFRVGNLMGHKDSKMVERYYGHLKPKNLRDSMALPRPVPGGGSADPGGRGTRGVTGVSEPVAADGASGP